MNNAISAALAVATMATGCASTDYPTGDVLAIQGSNTPYVQRQVMKADGKFLTLYGEIFEGWQFIRDKRGSCWLKLTRLEALATLNTEPGPVQRPTTSVTAFKVDCGSLTNDTLPTLPEVPPLPKPSLI